MNHGDGEHQWVARQLRSALPPVQAAELKADLWPRMLRRMDDRAPAFGWFEAMLAGAVTLAFVIFPELLPALLYHL